MVLAAFLGGFVAQRLAGKSAHAAEAGDVIRTKAVVLVDDQGKERGTFSAEAEGAKLVLRDREGKERVLLGYGSAPTPLAPFWGLFVRDAEGRDRYVCGADASGEGSGMGIWDWNGTVRYGLGAERQGCGFVLNNERGTEIISAGVGPGAGGGDLSLKHPADGHVVWQASRTPQNPPQGAAEAPPG
jgi:hypothetical protein